MSSALELGVCSLSEAGVNELDKSIQSVLNPIVSKWEKLLGTLDLQVAEFEKSLAVLEEAAREIEKPQLRAQKRVLQKLKEEKELGEQEIKDDLDRKEREKNRKVLIVYALFQALPPELEDIGPGWSRKNFIREYVDGILLRLPNKSVLTDKATILKHTITFYPSGLPNLAHLLGESKQKNAVGQEVKKPKKGKSGAAAAAAAADDGDDDDDGSQWGRSIVYHYDGKGADAVAKLTQDWNSLRAAFNSPDAAFEYCIVPLFLPTNIDPYKAKADGSWSHMNFTPINPFVQPFLQDPIRSRFTSSLTGTVMGHFTTQTPHSPLKASELSASHAAERPTWWLPDHPKKP